MKVRIKGNSVRYRLTRSELERFSMSGYLEETTVFPSGVFTYALQAEEDIDNIRAGYSDNKITLYFPDHEKRNWFESERVGYKNNLPIGNGESLFILIEKDFVCLDNVEEDQSDNYPNPNAVS